MKNKIAASLVFLVVVSLGGLDTFAAANGDKKHLETATYFINADSTPGKAVTAFHEALESNDPTTARSLLVDEVLIFEGGVERSADKYASHHLSADIKYLAALETTALEHRVEISGDLAASVGGKYRIYTGRNKVAKAVDLSGIAPIVSLRIIASPHPTPSHRPTL